MMTKEQKESERTSEVIKKLWNAVEALWEVREAIKQISTTNEDFIFLECAYMCTKMQSDLKTFLRIKLEQEE